MIRKRGLLLGPLVLVALVGASLSGSAIARGGGHGGGSGDSSMNPFTGDSYAYFNGGHNRGEQSLQMEYPSVYRLFTRFYRQDPASRTELLLEQ